MSTPHHGRHELGQNFLSDRRVIADIVEIVSRTNGPIIEIGAGDGALTIPLQRLARPLTAVEVDARRARRLAQRTVRSAPGPASRPTEVVAADFLRYPLPRSPHVVVGNLPFHLTTAILRRLLHGPGWTTAVLLMQWEVARRRAAVGGATMMTAQWWPWFEFGLARKVSAASFTPRPAVDAGLLTITRRSRPLVDVADRARYQALVHRVFTGRGHGMAQILQRLPTPVPRTWLRANGIAPNSLPRQLSAAQWAALFEQTRLTGAQRVDRPRDVQHGRAHRRRGGEVDRPATHHKQTGPVVGQRQPQRGRDADADPDDQRTAPPVTRHHQGERRDEDQADHQDRPLTGEHLAGEFLWRHASFDSSASTTLVSRKARVNGPTPPGLGDT
ncbi:23S rRNA (adenine(2058)-N(6))-methyltransferase Erm(38) [Mycolicibacterium smegmatis]|uniref:23S rRNA (adenine(2058)-N(6))-methyltransferase Erm(38) n=1 Tax=Mycolicibacterium smegmatis TaxID=1772 RepID=UPI001EFA96C7|nr:23S rRNA (adenine(2058)-N(6))-methyltransferase Erm(38) [Mycolicibacterium smegmatis]ULN36772.1 23S rRNA (adenine(2058)-N(6))-methyltransferase Erm(38) [Mycolicibacterium smegmatis]